MAAKDMPRVYYNNPDGRQFFKDLRDAIIGEYEKQGYCEYIDEFIEGNKKSINLIELSVIRELGLRFCENRELMDVDRTVYIPHCRDVVWGNWRQCGDIYRMSREDWNHLMSIRETGRRIHAGVVKELQRAKSYSGGRDDNSAAEVTRTLANAREEAEIIKAQAREEAEKIRAEAQRKADEVIERANQERTCMISDAMVEANDLRNAAPPAWDEEAAKERLGRHFEDYQAQIRSKQEQWAETARQEDVRVAEEADRIHRQMCDVTNAAQAVWGAKISETIEDLKNMEAEFFTRLREWQTALYPRDLERIARNYIELYRAVNIDKMIQAEAVFQISENPEKPSLATVEALEKLEAKLRTYLKRFEQALKGLGLYIQFPQEGELFDDVLHSCSGDPDESSVISKCITPAVIHKMEGEGNDNVVIRAEVEVRAGGKEAVSHEYFNV